MSRVMDLLNQTTTVINSIKGSAPMTQGQYSCEFFPIRANEGHQRVRESRLALTELNPEFYSVTSGAGGSTREGTLEAIEEIAEEGVTPAVPHLTGVGETRESVSALLEHYRSIGVQRLVVLRGDRPSGMIEHGDFRYAIELIEFIRERSGSAFHIDVAAYPEAHPETPSFREDIGFFRDKVKAGADSAITQYFYNVDAYLRFRDDIADLGITIPVVPGIMPITNYKQLARFSDTCGTEIPRWIRRRLEDYQDDLDSLRAFGADVVALLCNQLIEGDAPGLHFYTLNRSGPVLRVVKAMGSLA